MPPEDIEDAREKVTADLAVHQDAIEARADPVIPFSIPPKPDTQRINAAPTPMMCIA